MLIAGDGEQRDEGAAAETDQGGHQRPPDEHQLGHGDRHVQVRQVRKVQLYLHAGMCQGGTGALDMYNKTNTNITTNLNKNLF